MKNLVAYFPQVKRDSKRGPFFYSKTGAWDFTGMFLRNQERWLFDPLILMVRAVTNVSTRKWPRVIWAFLRKCRRLHKANGAIGLVLYLKTAQLVLMQSMAGMKVQNPRTLGSAIGRTRGGLPTIIPAHHRARIRMGETTLLRVWISLLSLYRVIEFPGTLKLATITERGKDFRPGLFDDFILTFYGMLAPVAPRNSIVRFINIKFLDELYGTDSSTPSVDVSLVPRQRKYSVSSWATENLKASPFIIQKASPLKGMSSTLPMSVLLTAQMLLEQSPTVYRALTEWCMHTKNEALAKFLLLSAMTGAKFRLVATYLGEPCRGFLGRLGVKPEPAGKLRVYAIVDCWTQWLMKPLHLAIQRLLRSIPQDGTFDQLQPVRRLIKMYGPNHTAYSYDLSAATDRLPISIQAGLLGVLLGFSVAKAWVQLLVGREYQLPSTKSYTHAEPRKERLALPGSRQRAVKYAVGQPMGALSSWVMLALTHHFIVQLAAVRVRSLEEWYEGYAVLGDDLVIMDQDVAEEYLSLMDGVLGVKINLSKSLISERHTTLEFAKKYFYKGEDCSPISFKELKESRQNISVWAEFGRRFGLSSATLLNLWGFSPRRSRLLSKGLFDMATFKWRKAWNIAVHVLLFKENRFALDTRSALHRQLLDITKDIQKKLEGWDVNIPLPLVNEVARDTGMEGDSWVSKVQRVLTLVLRPPSVLLDFFPSAPRALNRALVTGGQRLGWPGYASEALYGKNVLFYLTKLGACQKRCEKLMTLVISSSETDLIRLAGVIDDLSHEVDGIPKGAIESWERASHSEEALSLWDQIRKLRRWWGAAAGKVIVMRKTMDGMPTQAKEASGQDSNRHSSDSGTPL